MAAHGDRCGGTRGCPDDGDRRATDAQCLGCSQISSMSKIHGKEQRITLLDGEIYTMSRKSKRTMILLRLDELCSSGEARYNFPLITIEHVLPQSPPAESEWTGWWPDPVVRERDVHRLGNLVLLNRRQNSSAKNYPFDQKKRSYFAGRDGSSPFAITTQVLREPIWTPDVFERRQALLLQKLKDVWRL